MSIKSHRRPQLAQQKGVRQLMDKEAKIECLKVIRNEPEESISEQDRLVMKLLELDIADGGLRFEQLYYASNSFYG